MATVINGSDNFNTNNVATQTELDSIPSILVASYSNYVNGDSERENFANSQVMSKGNDFWIVGGATPVANPLIRVHVTIPFSHDTTWTDCKVKWYYRINGGGWAQLTTDAYDLCATCYNGSNADSFETISGIFMHTPTVNAGDTIEYIPYFDAASNSNNVTVPSFGLYNSGSAYAYLSMDIIDKSLTEVTYA